MSHGAMSGKVEIRPTDLDHGNNWCDACVVLIGEHTIAARAGEGYVTRTMRLCNDHLVELGDAIQERNPITSPPTDRPVDVCSCGCGAWKEKGTPSH